MKELVEFIAKSLVDNPDEVTVTERETGLTVEDTAGGIAPEDAEHIFESWYRGSTGKTKGYGLGLSIVARVCRRCKWTIAHANTDAGSRFDVVLKPQEPEA